MNLNNFGPFNAEVWGTTSDWIMVSVTALTARYLWLTLRSQYNLQRLQQETTTIEKARYMREIMPRFEINYSAELGQEDSVGVNIPFSLLITLKDNPAKNVSITLQQNPDETQINYDFEKVTDYMNVNTDILLMGNYKSLKNTAVNNNFHLIFWTFSINLKMDFMDIAGNSYRQFLIGDIDSNGKKFIANHPEPLNK